jgi:nitrous oxide reductase accessory protein NosL
MKKIILSAVFATLLVTACNKRDAPAPPIPSLIGKWGIVNIHEKEVFNGTIVYDDTYPGQSSDYMEFKNDNTVSYYVDGFGLILNYKLLPDNKVEISGETMTIKTLTGNNATLYLKYDSGPNSFEETTYNLKR